MTCWGDDIQGAVIYRLAKFRDRIIWWGDILEGDILGGYIQGVDIQ